MDRRRRSRSRSWDRPRSWDRSRDRDRSRGGSPGRHRHEDSRGHRDRFRDDDASFSASSSSRRLPPPPMDRGTQRSVDRYRDHARMSDAPRLDWACATCSVSNFARREQCFKCGAPRTPDCKELPTGPGISGGGLGGGSGGGAASSLLAGPSIDELAVGENGGSGSSSASRGAANSAVLLVRHLPRDATEASVADAFRVYAPVRAVRLVQDPRPGASKSPAGLVDFFSPSSCAHALTASAGFDVRVSGSLVQPEPAKASAMAIPDTWPARLASAVSRLGPTAASSSSSSSSSRPRSNSGAGAGSSGYGSGSSSSHRDPRASSSQRQSAAEEAALLRARHLKKATPLWPPPFEADGAAWVFDPASTYFCHRATGMFYEPKAKWYGKQDASTGAYVYYRHAPGKDPPFERMDTAAAPAAASTAQATGGAAGDVVAVPGSQQQPTAHAQAALRVAPAPVAPATAAAAAAAAAAEGAAAVAAAEALARREAAKASKAAKSSTARKNLSAISSWKERAQKEAAAEPDNASAATPAAGSSSSSSSSSSPGSGDSTSAAALLMTLGTDFATVHLLGLKPDDDSTGSSGRGGMLGPLAESNGSKWACLVSRRAFATEEQLAKHIRLSQLYHDELAKAVTQGRVVLRPKAPATERST